MNKIAITRDGGFSGPLVLNGTLDAGGTVLTVTFAGTAVTAAGSLPDGRYTLTYDGQPVNGTATFHRFFGDIDGDQTVNFTDFLAFRSVFGATAVGNPFDENNDGVVNFADFLAFRTRFGLVLP